MQSHPKRFKSILKIVAALFLLTMAFNWAWNTAMPVLFEFSEIRFREALAILVLLATPSFLLGRRHKLRDDSDIIVSKA